MSNVRRRENTQCTSPNHSRGVESLSSSLRISAPAPIRSKGSTLGSVAMLRPVRSERNSSARAEARARTNVGQSVGPQPHRARKALATRETSVACPRGLRLKSGMQPSGSSTATPNPSIEGTHKRLRLLWSPHVKR